MPQRTGLNLLVSLRGQVVLVPTLVIFVGQSSASYERSRWPGVVQVLSTWKRGYFFLTAQQSATATWPNAQKSSVHAYFWCPRQNSYLLTALLKLLFYFWTSDGLQLLSCCELQVVNRLVRLLTPRAFCLFITYDHKRSVCLWLDPNSHESAFRNDCK